nr:hypothetical protein [Tanacetum cinerariifolium]
RLRHVLENAHEDDDRQILSSKRDQETLNGTLGAEGLPDMIHRSVAASKPKMMQEAIEIATELMDKKGTGSGQKLGCYECGVQGHFRRECTKIKNNNNHGNQGGRNNALARVYAVGRAGTDPY